MSFTKAAKVLHISQPAVTRHIKELESELDIRLIQRKGHEVTLTEAGILLLKHIDQLQQIEQGLKFSFSSMKEKISGELKFGVSTTIAQYIIPPILSSFYNQYPHVKIDIYTANTRTIESKIKNGEIEFGLVEGNLSSKDLKYEPFMEDEIVIAGNPQCQLTQFDILKKDQLSQAPIVLREDGSGTLDVIERSLKRDWGTKLADLNVVMQLDSTEAIKSFVRSTKSLAFFSIHSIYDELAAAQLKIVDLEGLDLKRVFHIIYPQGPEPKGVSRQFIRYLKHQISNFGK